MEHVEHYWIHELEKLREEQRHNAERPALRLPLPAPYYDELEMPVPLLEEPSRGVVIIDMFDYEESQ